jgi:hypothetical protein
MRRAEREISYAAETTTFYPKMMDLKTPFFGFE